MKKFSTLFKILLKTSFKTDKSKKTKVALSFAYVYLAAVFGFAVYYLVGSFAPIFSAENLLSEFIMLVLIVLQVITLLFGITLIISGLYFSKDYEVFATLPISEKVYFWAKILKIYLFLAVLSLFFTIMVIIAFASVFAISVWFVLSLVVVSLIAPFISMAIATALVVLFMPLFNRFKKYKLTMSILGAIIVGVLFYFYFSFANSGIFDVENTTITLSQNFKNVINILKNVLFIDYSLSNLVLKNDILMNLSIIFAFVTFILLINYLLSKLAYKQGVRYAMEIGENINKNQLKIEKNTFFMLLKREWLSISRYPSLFIYLSINIILTPILILIMGGSMNGLSMDSALKAFEVFAVIVFFGSSLQMISISAFTREGENFYTLKSLPVSLKKQADVKLVFAIISIVISSLVNVSVSIFAFKISSLYALLIFVLSLIIGIAMALLTILVDAKKPRLHSDTVYSALQNHPATIMSMAINSLFILVGVVLFVVMLMAMKLDFTTCILIEWIYIGVYSVGLMIIAYIKYNRNIEKYLLEVE